MNRFLPVLLFNFIALISSAQIYERTDTLFIPEISSLPIIDGVADDPSWDAAGWQSIDQIWMPYGNEADNIENGLKLWDGADDFNGKYKVVWSAETNLLYFLVTTTDDIFTGGYQYSENPNSGGGYPNYDIVEVFIDEDRSGGLHVFDGTGSTANNWGTNAENAFSYHIAANEPEDGNTESTFNALDIAGSNWGYPNQKIAEYSDHFADFAVHRDGTNYTWEFSLIVHDDTFNPLNAEASIVNLTKGKIMGLSMAYCDNDSPMENPLQRDHFFGSVYVPESAYNDHWMQANWFGVAKLAAAVTSAAPEISNNKQVNIKSYISSGWLNTTVESSVSAPVKIRVFNILGSEIISKTWNKNGQHWNKKISLNGEQGIYIVEVVHANTKKTTKVVIR